MTSYRTRFLAKRSISSAVEKCRVSRRIKPLERECFEPPVLCAHQISCPAPLLLRWGRRLWNLWRSGQRD